MADSSPTEATVRCWIVYDPDEYPGGLVFRDKLSAGDYADYLRASEPDYAEEIVLEERVFTEAELESFPDA